MSKLTDMQIRAWIKAGEHFDGRGDGGGLWLRFPQGYATPTWRFRYRFDGRARSIDIGNYAALSLADARKESKKLKARVALGHDVAGEKQERKREAVAKIEAGKLAWTTAKLADEYFERNILGRWKHPNIVRSRIEKDIKPSIGRVLAKDVQPAHIDAMLQKIVKRGAPTVSNDVLRWTRRIFDYGVKRHIVKFNPASAFSIADAGGKEEARSRSLSRDELVKLFEAMRMAKGFSVENMHSVRLLLLLAVRKNELLAAKVSEFELHTGIWRLPVERTKTGAGIDIPLPAQAIDSIRELIRLGGGSEYLLPARKVQDRMLPHIHEGTLNVALSKAKVLMKDVPAFTIHDFRRTARTHLAALGVDPHIAERCLNHKIKGVEGIYNRHDYFSERKDALMRWARFVEACEKNERLNVVAGKFGKAA